MCKLYVIGVGPGLERYLTDLAKKKMKQIIMVGVGILTCFQSGA